MTFHSPQKNLDLSFLQHSMHHQHHNGIDSARNRYQTTLTLVGSVRANIEKLYDTELPSTIANLQLESIDDNTEPSSSVLLCKELAQARLHRQFGDKLRIVPGTANIIKEYVYRGNVTLSEYETVTLLKMLQWCDLNEIPDNLSTEILLELAYRINQSNAVSTYLTCRELADSELISSVLEHCKAVIQALAFDKRANDVVGLKDQSDLMVEILFGTFKKLSFSTLEDHFLSDLSSCYGKGSVQFSHNQDGTDIAYYCPAVLLANSHYFRNLFSSDECDLSEPIDLYYLGLSKTELQSLGNLQDARISFTKKLIQMWYTGTIDITKEEALVAFRICEYLQIDWSDPLITHCLNIITSSVTRDNVLDLVKEIFWEDNFRSELQPLKEISISCIMMNWEHFPRDHIKRKVSSSLLIEVIDALKKEFVTSD